MRVPLGRGRAGASSRAAGRARDHCEGLVVTGEPIASEKAKPKYGALPLLEVRPHGSLKDAPPPELLHDFCRLRRGLVTEKPDELLLWLWLLPRLQRGLSRAEVLEWLGPPP